MCFRKLKGPSSNRLPALTSVAAPTNHDVSRLNPRATPGRYNTLIDLTMPVPTTITSRILIAAARGLPIRLDKETCHWLEELSRSGHITLNGALESDAITVTARLTRLGQELLDWLER